MPELPLYQWCDQLVRASVEQDLAALGEAAMMLSENAGRISGPEAESALAALAVVTATTVPEPALWAASAGVELIRHGAPPDQLLAPLFGSLKRMLGMTADFLETWEYCVALEMPGLETMGIIDMPPDPDAPDAIGTPPDPALITGLQAGLTSEMSDVIPKMVYWVEEIVQNWWYLGRWVQTATALLELLPRPEPQASQSPQAPQSPQASQSSRAAQIPYYDEIVEAVVSLTMSDAIADLPYRCDALHDLAAALSASPVDFWTTTVLYAHLEQDGRLLAVATQRAVAAAEGRPPRDLETALEPLAEVIASAPPIIGRWVALTGGAFVESGAPPDCLVGPVFTALRQVMELALEFAACWQETRAEALPDPEGVGRPQPGTEAEHRLMVATAEKLAPRSGDRAFEVTMGWWALCTWTLSANALLSHSPRIRTLIPDPDRLTALLDELLPITGALAGLRHRLRHLADHLSDAPDIGRADTPGPGDSGHEHYDRYEGHEHYEHHEQHARRQHHDPDVRHDRHDRHDRYDHHDPRLDAAAELTTAALLADTGDLATAAAHIGTALAYAPDFPAAYEALFKLAARAGGTAVDLFPLGGNHLAYTIGRAHLLGAGDDPDAGLDLLLAVVAYDPERPWSAVPWVADPEVPRRMDPDRIADTYLKLLPSLPSPPESMSANCQRALMPLLDLGRNAVASHPGHGLLHGGVASLARRFGAWDEAIALATRGEQLDPSWLTTMCAASAYSTAGRVDEALAAYQRMLRFDPENTAVLTDIAELLADAGRFDEALDWIARALAIAPRDPAAFPTACALRFADDRDVAHLVALADFLQDRPDAEHGHRMLAAGCAGHPWLAHVPAGLDGAAAFLDTPGAVAGFRAGIADDPDPWIELDTIELPSAMAVLGRVLPDVSVRIGTVPEPDPRSPRCPTDTAVWSYEGTTARPAVPAPSPDGARAIADLATLAMGGWPSPTALHATSAHLAGLPIGDLLGALVHPPEPPTTTPDPDAPPAQTRWVRAVQTIACVGILHHRANQVWMLSTRRRILIDLAFGVEDWITEVALFGLVVAAWVEPEARADVAGLLAARLADVVEIGTRRRVPIALAVAGLALSVPDLPAAATEQAQAVIARAYAEYEADELSK
ncbi:tetratricopeptide repeat protein [Catenulispora sp. NF23]|uniref:tetratricopeptide repeat protein n=1 Tax=Catenulispora pinistramenti TaxID=2705254 RepID=UPI001BA700BE|nr:tetratricopeptide repeat protein [Catenulispora pinistramenti]MBS2537142.1 tetratricopeptide repeat protein [Catenulispora pinistramenti]